MRRKVIGYIALLSIFALAGCGSSSNSNAGIQLSSLTISSGTLSPAFASGKADYAVSVDSSVTSITVIPTAKNSGATITVNDVAVNSGDASGSIDLVVGDTTITITVTGKDGGATYTYTITVTRAAIGTGGIGSACSCDNSAANNTCTAVIFPDPPGTPITGCGNVTNIPTGAVLLCLRSYNSTTQGIPSTYFAGGYCSVGAATCSGNDYICTNLVNFGTYNDMDSCPSGSVMLKDSYAVIYGATLNVATKVCAKSCTTASDCRTGETDTEFGGALTQYTCSDNNTLCKDENGVANTAKFCYDPRNISTSCVVKAF